VRRPGSGEVAGRSAPPPRRRPAPQPRPPSAPAASDRIRGRVAKSRGVVTKGCAGESQGATGAAPLQSHLRGRLDRQRCNSPSPGIRCRKWQRGIFFFTSVACNERSFSYICFCVGVSACTFLAARFHGITWSASVFLFGTRVRVMLFRSEAFLHTTRTSNISLVGLCLMLEMPEIPTLYKVI